MGIRLQGNALHLLFRDARSLLVLPGVESGANFKSSGRLGAANEFQDGLVVAQWLSRPVAADEGKHPVLDGIPLGGAWRIMADLDLKPEMVAESKLQLMLPQTGAIAVASATVGKHEQALGSGIVSRAGFLPPSAYSRYGELGGVVAGTHANKAFIAAKIIDAVGNGNP